eukprot:1149977-Pelagomonas_calceolata.AAC.1
MADKAATHFNNFDIGGYRMTVQVAPVYAMAAMQAAPTTGEERKGNRTEGKGEKGVERRGREGENRKEYKTKGKKRQLCMLRRPQLAALSVAALLKAAKGANQLLQSNASSNSSLFSQLGQETTVSFPQCNWHNLLLCSVQCCSSCAAPGNKKGKLGLARRANPN